MRTNSTNDNNSRFSFPSLWQKNPQGNWKRPLVYSLLLITGAGGALLGQNLLCNKQLTSVGAATQTSPRAIAQSPAISNRVGMPTWLAANRNMATDNFIVEAVDKVGPAVVRINASRSQANFSPNPSRGQLPRDFFGVEEGTGSGFILSAEGHILTNAHVVEGTDVVEVILKDGRQYQGRVLGTDKVTDVAVVKIEANNLPTVNLGNSQELKPGEWAIAIGNPLGLDNSVTIGIVSATGRSSYEVGVSDKRVGFIQTDAAINPGNSGGPLLNDRGEVIGMNTAIVSEAQGLGFAIPINSAMLIADQLIASGKAQHAYLGIAMKTITPELKRETLFRSSVDRGVLIVQVMPGSPAERDGLRPGDVILKLDGEDIARAKTVQQLVQTKTVGSLVQLEIERQGQIVNLQVLTGNLPREFGG